MADIAPLILSYPDFMLGQVIDPEEFDQNNAEIVDKVNETIDVVNIHTVGISDSNTKADNAVTTANSADTKADNAIIIANSAETKADNAITIANSAETKADNAVTTANSAETKADNAVTMGNEAKNIATNLGSIARAIANSADIAANMANAKADNAVIIANAADTKITTHLADNTQHVNYAVTTGTSTRYVLTLNPAPNRYIEGMKILVKFHVESGNGAMINVNGLGNKFLYICNDIPEPRYVMSGDLTSNNIYEFVYYGDGFFLVNGKALYDLKTDFMSHLADYVRIELSEFAPFNPRINTWWYEDLGETADLGKSEGGLLLGNASTEGGDDVWFDEV